MLPSIYSVQLVTNSVFHLFQHISVDTNAHDDKIEDLEFADIVLYF